MNRSLKQVTRTYYDEISLSDTQLQQLMAMQQATEPVSERTVSYWPHAGWACALLVLVLWGTQWLLVVPVAEGYPKAYSIAREVVDNHFNRKPLETRGQNFSQVRQYFSQLQFKPIFSDRVSGGWLTGGRYCSLESIPAAQFRLQDGQGQEQTWYEVDYNPEVFGPLPDVDKGAEPVTVYARGVAVDIWVERGVLFAVTRDVVTQY